jgi:Xaa-Pro dipeptidase
MTTTTSLPLFSMGLDTFEVPVAGVFVANRCKLVECLKASGVAGAVFLEGGISETRFDSDHEPIFRQESYFWYLSGVKEPDCSLVVHVETGATCLFVPHLAASYATIMGPIRTFDEWKNIYLVDQVRYTSEVEEHILGLLEKPVAASGEEQQQHSPAARLFLLKGLNSDSGKMYQPPLAVTTNPKLAVYEDLEHLFPVLAECRVIKSEAELDLLQHVTQVTSFAHAYVMRNMKSGMMEYQGEALFRFYCHYNFGCRLVGYTPICGCGPSAAILHYGHAGEPNAKQSRKGDICLYDMGAEYFGYGSDVTCSFPIDGKFSDLQRPIFTAVLLAQVAVYDMMKPGVSWVDCHKAAERAILNALIDLRVVVLGDSTVEKLVELRLGAVFMPHGLGHLIGIDTHDVGGYLQGHPERIQEPGLKSLRTARILQENMTLTVEPGCYFIDHLLDGALSDTSPLRQYLNSGKIQEYRSFGGVRLEDVVQVTSTGCVNYTLCPRTIDEIESVMTGGKWPPIIDSAPELRRVRLTDPSPLRRVTPYPSL